MEGTQGPPGEHSLQSDRGQEWRRILGGLSHRHSHCSLMVSTGGLSHSHSSVMVSTSCLRNAQATRLQYSRVRSNKMKDIEIVGYLLDKCGGPVDKGFLHCNEWFVTVTSTFTDPWSAPEFV
uniref:Uncharacterized protein n=1 Tax=Timema monikensis TaxID=170555 RepID=A0A7R9EHC5_9NEOP|nr:unnamed protein product [Timema monikensis]